MLLESGISCLVSMGPSIHQLEKLIDSLFFFVFKVRYNFDRFLMTFFLVCFPFVSKIQNFGIYFVSYNEMILTLLFYTLLYTYSININIQVHVEILRFFKYNKTKINHQILQFFLRY